MLELDDGNGGIALWENGTEIDQRNALYLTEGPCIRAHQRNRTSGR
jgi:hypothetical protein